MYIVLDKFLFVMRSCSVKEPIYFKSNVNNYIQLQRNKKKNYKIFAVDKRGVMLLIEPLIAINTPGLGVQLTRLTKSVNQDSGIVSCLIDKRYVIDLDPGEFSGGGLKLGFLFLKNVVYFLDLSKTSLTILFHVSYVLWLGYFSVFAICRVFALVALFL